MSEFRAAPRDHAEGRGRARGTGDGHTFAPSRADASHVGRPYHSEHPHPSMHPKRTSQDGEPYYGSRSRAGSGKGAHEHEDGHGGHPAEVPIPSDLAQYDVETAADMDKTASDAWTKKYLEPLRPEFPTVFILRGISGSGKSSIARFIQSCVPAADIRICSADDYFIARGNGVYAFDVSLLDEAHKACRSSFERALADGVPFVILDNTNTTFYEYEPYLSIVSAHNSTLINKLAEHAPLDTSQFVYNLQVVEIRVSDPIHVELFVLRNTHNVPSGVLRAQASRFQTDEDAVPIPAFVPPSKQPLVAALRARAAAMKRRATVEETQDAMRAAAAAVCKPRGVVVATAEARIPGPHVTGTAKTTVAVAAAAVETGTFAALPLEVVQSHLKRTCAYMGIFLDAASRARLADACGSQFAMKRGDHITVKYSPKAKDFTLDVLHFVGWRVKLAACLHIVADGVQAVAVAACKPSHGDASGKHGGRSRDTEVAAATRMAGIISHLSNNGISSNEVPHVTISTTRSIDPSHANDVLQSFTRRGRHGARIPSAEADRAPDALVEAIHVPITGTFGFCVRQGPILTMLLSQKNLERWLGPAKERPPGSRRHSHHGHDAR